MKKSEIIIIMVLALISFSFSLYFYITLIAKKSEQPNTTKKSVEFPNPISEESVSKPSTFLGTIFSKITPTYTPTPTSVPTPATATEFMQKLERTYTDGDTSTLNALRTDASAL